MGAKVYKAKIDWWMHLSAAVMFAADAFILYLAMTESGVWSFVALAVMLLCSILVVFIYIIKYELREDELLIRFGVFKQRVKYAEIKTIKESRCMLASLAPSVDRVEITYAKWGLVYVSPKEKAEFMKELQSRL